jgi:hypothetical protein
MSFKISSGGTEVLGPADTCGRFIDILLGVLASAPEYVRSSDAGRHAAMLLEFRRFEFDDHRRGQEPVKAPVATAPVTECHFAARQWVSAYLGSENHPLMSTFAVDTVRFMQAHALGQYQSGVTGPMWRIERMFDRPTTSGRRGPDEWGIIDQDLKRDITSVVGGLWVEAQVGEKCRVFDRDERARPILESGDRFLFRIHRCHLSQSFSEFPALEVEEDDPPPIDIAGDDEFYGSLALGASGGAIQPFAAAETDVLELGRQLRFKREFRIAPRWITAALLHRDRKLVRLPVPAWSLTR